MAQQTAVNFLYEFVQLKLTHEQQMQFEGLFQQAKQMEKEQSLNAFQESRLTHPMIGFKHKTFLEYYSETYGQGSSDTTSPNTQNK